MKIGVVFAAIGFKILGLSHKLKNRLGVKPVHTKFMTEKMIKFYTFFVVEIFGKNAVSKPINGKNAQTL